MHTHDILKKYWGYSAFRPLQEEVINAVLQSKDTLALMPTGGGKSICFQVPGLLLEGICIVVSPLIALMKDQVYNLKKKGIKAAAIHAGLSLKEIDIILDNCIYGDYKFLYVSPERLETELFLERFKRMHVNLIAVDEAHCISQWGYDFRPSYLKIADIRSELPEIPILALTASATKQVVADIQEKLHFKATICFQKSFNRANLTYLVLDVDDKYRKLLEIIRKVKGSGLIYVRNRKKTKDIATFLKENKQHADHYHAGLPMALRAKKQEAWLKGQNKIMVCTNAFGMGIDKPDVRFIIHWEIPDSIEAYYQEAGRAGRDEQLAYAVTLYNQSDDLIIQQRIKDNYPDMSVVKNIYNALGSYFKLAVGGGAEVSYNFDIAEFSDIYNFKPAAVYYSLRYLQQEGWLTLSEAFYSRSRLKIIISKQDFYKFEVENRKYEPLIRAILRMYGGVYDDFVKINEGDLAIALSANIQVISKMLTYLKNSNIIFYEAAKDQPQLTFLHARVTNNNLQLNQKFYKTRIKIEVEKMQEALKYAKQQDICRNIFILRYFGEKDALPCGKCDVCKKEKNYQLTHTEFLQIKDLILNYLKITSSSLKDLVSTIEQNELKVLSIIRRLKEEGLIIEEGDFLVIKKKNENNI